MKKKLSLKSLEVKSFSTTHASVMKGGISGGDDCTEGCDTITTISEGIDPAPH